MKIAAFPSSPRPRRFAAGLALIGALALAACQQAQKDTSESAPDGKPGLVASGGTLVLPAVKGRPGVAYFTVANNSDTATSLASVYIDGVGKTEMHETKNGTMGPLNWVELKPGDTVKFERGAKHVMAFDIGDKLVAGGTTEMTLTFSGGDKLSAPLKIESMGSAPAPASSDSMAGMESGH